METEQQQIDELKVWWKENGRSIIAGLVIGLGGIFGWTSWRSHQIKQAEQASVRYEQLINDAATSAHSQVLAQVQSLIEEFPDSAYASLAALLAASSAAAQDNIDGARQQLQWVVAHPGVPELAAIAQLRLARLALGELEFDAALAALEKVDPSSMRAAVDELRGDIQQAKGNTPSARDAYVSALARETLSEPGRARLQMKLDDMGHVNMATP